MSEPERALVDLAALREKATAGKWRSKKGPGPDGFAPTGYRYVEWGKPGDGFGTDQLSPEDADFIAAAGSFDFAALVEHLRDELTAAIRSIEEAPFAHERLTAAQARLDALRLALGGPPYRCSPAALPDTEVTE